MKRLVMTAALLAVCQTWAAKVSSVTARTADGKAAGASDVLVRCEVKPGSEYDPAACARDVQALKNTGEYEDIAVEASHGATGVEVVYVVTRKLRFQAPLQAKGNEFWGASKIAKLSELVDGYAYGEADFAAAAGRIRAEYRKKHFADVQVTPVVEPVPGSDDAVTVTMEIVEGPRVKIRDYNFDGNEKVEADDLRAALGDYPWWNPLGWFTDKPVTEQELAEACDKVRAVYRNRGYLDATVSMPEKVAAGEDEADYVFRVDEGPCFTVGSIAVSGVKHYPEAAALASVKALAVGDVAGEEALAAAAHQLEIFCESGDNPLAETRVDVRRLPSAEDDSKLDVTFVVTEGVPVVIDRVLVRGNDYTQDKVIRREIKLSPGDRMIGDKAEQSKRRLENLRYFDRVRYYLEKTDAVAKEGEPEHRDLVYEVSEKSTGQFMVGVGASSVDSVYGTIELSESNFDLFNPWRFRGAGQKGRLLLQAGPRVQTYEASVTEPWFLDRQLELTVEGYRRQRWYDDYDVIRNGAAVTLAYPVKFWPTAEAKGRLGFKLAAEFIQMDDVENDKYYLTKGFGKYAANPDDPGAVFRWQDDEYGDNWEIPFRVFWQLDERDNFFIPTRGFKSVVYGDLVGGDNNYWKVGFNYRHYWTVWKKYGHVFSFGLRAETEDTFSDDMPIYDKLFLGGPRSIRGVDYREISPRVYSQPGKKGHYAPWGGQTSWCMNLEYTVPVCKYVRVAAFSDLGSVGEDEFDFDQDMFCWSVGLGLRIDIEQFPIRLDFATPVVDPDEDVDEEVFSFTIGYDF
ncbi:MAG: outer membrane protein assembly factor BamA [Kiritimatiellae bacterium]|nr:outer membrane protein assembly factor BamA [Kiritimatiellia bacterium]